ncbi:phage integrase [Pseudomonas abyssi]|uniref:phage integrase n=1 Tax=Pseudomonas abyssi TaxID=170540 RepID=UPI003C7AE775
MAITKQPDGRWKADVEPVKGKRFRKTFKTKAEALRFEATCRSKVALDGDWSPKPKDKRKLLELVEQWYQLHGVTLANGVQRHAILVEYAKALGNPVARTLNGSAVARLRSAQLKAGLAPKTANNRLGYLKAVYNQLHEMGVIDYRSPINLRPIKLQENPLTYLTRDQITELLAVLDSRPLSPHPAMIARICLATGARWGEAQALTPERVKGGSVLFANTKSKRVRSVPIAPGLHLDLVQHWRRHGPFTQCMNGFRKALELVSFKLPRGQASHVLRHTFASHFIMNGGNIVTLQKVLGHSSLSMTLRYAHLSPDHLSEAVRLNPLFDTLSTQGHESKEKSL